MPATTTLATATSRLHVLELVGNAIVGGMEQSVARLVERLPIDRFGVTVLCPFESRFTEQLRGFGADVVIAAIDDDPSWSSIQLASALVKTSAVDVLHAHLPNAHVLAGIVGRLADKPVLATIHGRSVTSMDLEVHRAASTHLAVVCRQTYFQALGVGVAPKQLHLVPNGVDTDVFTPGRAHRGALRAAFGIGDGVPVVGFVGRLHWEKGPDVFVRMSLAVRAALPEAHFVLIGAGPMRRQLETFVESFGLAGQVHFAGLQADMPAIYGELDMLVSSSHSEALPLVVMEAMASGLAVVATNVGGVPDLVQQDQTGWLVGQGDYDGMAERVIELLQDEPLRLAAGAAGRARAVQQFSLADSIGQTMQLLTRLAQPRSETRRAVAAATTTV